MNLAMIRQYQASVLVTKESGKTGGEDTKLAAAGEAQIPSYIILRPDEKTPVMDMDEVLEQLRRLEIVTLLLRCFELIDTLWNVNFPVNASVLEVTKN